MPKLERRFTDEHMQAMRTSQGGKKGERKFPLPAFNLSTWRFILGALAFWGLFVTLKAWELNEKNAQSEAKIQSLRGELWQHEQQEDGAWEKAYAPKEGPAVAGSSALPSEVQ